MNPASINIPGSMPSDSQFHAESLHAIEVCQQHCHCPDHWHFLWAAMKAAGLRRGIYWQQSLFDALLAPRRLSPQRVLIAGSADAGALHVLHRSLGQGHVYHAIDRCQSPLQLLGEYAQSQGLPFSSARSDIQSPPAGPWDIILVHNTLVFLPEAQRIETLRRMAASLSTDGIILCAMRYNTALAETPPAAIHLECEKTHGLIARTFSAEPQIQRQLDPQVEAFVRGQLASLSQRASRPQFLAELASAGLRIVQTYPDHQVLPSVNSELNESLHIEAELMQLQPA